MAFADRAHAEAVIPISERPRAREFYRDTLGFELLRDEEAGMWFEAGRGSRLSLYESVGAGQSRHTLASFHVDDLEAAMEELRGRGVVFEEYDQPGMKTENGVASIGELRGAFFKDPDGNILAVTEEVPA